MTRLDLLLYHLGQMKSSVEELKEAVNPREQAARIFEIRSYYRQLGEHLERLENEHFRKDPAKGLQRALNRHKKVEESQGNNL